MNKNSRKSMLLFFTLILMTCFSLLEAGKKVRIEGVVLSSTPQRMIVDDLRGRQFIVLLEPGTEIQEQTKNFLRYPRIYRPSDLMRGLRVLVRGRQDQSGLLTAKSIKMKHMDLKVASTVEARASQFDTQLGGMEQDMIQLGGQVEELTSTSARIRKDARDTGKRLGQVMTDLQKTRLQADENARKGGYLEGQLSNLDDYLQVESITVQFQVGSVELAEEARKQLDELLTSATERRQGILFQVTGFASSDGPIDFNRHLSRRRAESVIQYLAEEHSVPLRWFVRPHGFGEFMAVADNSTSEGRQANRRAEVKVLLNRAIAELAMN